jgi:hypothetical protein
LTKGGPGANFSIELMLKNIGQKFSSYFNRAATALVLAQK